MDDEKMPYSVDAKFQWQAAQMIMREINRIQFLDYFKSICPALVTELRKKGVVFP